MRSGRIIEILRQDAAEQGVEIRPVIRLPEMAEFVENHVVDKVFRKAQQIEIQVDIALGRAASPVREIVLDYDPAVFEPETAGKYVQFHRKVNFRLLPYDIHKHAGQPFFQCGVFDIAPGVSPGRRKDNGPDTIAFIVQLIGYLGLILKETVGAENNPTGQYAE